MIAAKMTREQIDASFAELARLNLATMTGRQFDLTNDGRDWMLAAIWVALGTPGFHDSFYDRKAK